MASRQGGPDTDGVSTDSRGVSLTNAPTTPAIDRRDAASVPSRDPTAYAQTDHFRRRLRQTGRYLSLPLVAHAIRAGQLRFNPADGWRFATVVNGVRLVTVVGDADTDSPVLVTGWTEVADRETAVASDRWSRLDVETITLRSSLADADDRQCPGAIRPRVVARPFEMGDHQVSTAGGDSFVECHDCGARFRSKRALVEKRCRR